MVAASPDGPVAAWINAVIKRKNGPMKMQNTAMRRLSALHLCGACLLSCFAVSTAFAAPAAPAAKSNEVTSVKGTCTFHGKESTWSAKLTAKGTGTYDAVYVASWGGSPLNYVGTIKTDLKSEISGDGKASGGHANGAFAFSGKYGTNNIAQCSYNEVGGRQRNGTMTAELPK